MAIVTDPGFTGRIGNLIYYNRDGKKYVRTIPDSVRQTKATKKKATEFGRASAIGASIRRGLSPVIPNSRDQKMQTRLVSMVFQWLNQLEKVKSVSGSQPLDLGSFSFMEKGISVHRRWKVNLQINHSPAGPLEAKISGFTPNKAFEAPANSAAVICRLAIATIDVVTGTLLGEFYNEMGYDLNSKPVAAQTLPVNLPTPKGSLIVTAMKLDFMKSINGHQQPNTNKAFMPSEIMDAIYI